MDLCVNLLLIVTLVITLELEQVLQVVVMHLAIQYCFNRVLLLTVDESCGWGQHRGQLDHGEDGVKTAKVVREFKVVCAMADASFDDKGA
jgi:hypothetical protein